MADDFDPYYQWLGIPPKHQPPNHYRLLALEEFESNLDVIENAADQRMAHVRMFQSGPHGEISQRLLNEITAAKLCLLNLAKKAEYDHKLRAEKDAAEPRRLKPLPRLEPTPAAAEAYRIAPDVPSAVPSAEPRAGRRLSPHQAAMIGAALGTLIVAVVFYVTFMGSPRNGDSRQDTAVHNHPGNSSTQTDPNVAKTLPVEPKTEEKTSNPVIPKASDQSVESVFLDDLQEQDSKVGAGTLGKRGSRGFGDELPAASYQGKKMPHALATHPPPAGVSYVVYQLNGEFATLRAIAALLEFHGQLQAHGPLTFKVLGDDKLLWQSPNPLQRLGTGEPCVVNIQGVKTLRLEVHCPGSAGHAYAAWLMPSLSRRPLTGQPAPSVTSLANPDVLFVVPDEHYAVIRSGGVEAVIVDNTAVDNDVLKGHRLGYHGVASLTHKARAANLFVPAHCGLHLAFVYDGTNHPHDVHAEPRRSPIELRVVSERIVELYQKPTPLWALESAIRYELLDDGVIEMTFECIPRQKTFSKGYVGLYFSSYIDRAESPDVCFPGHDDGDKSNSRWVRAVSPAHGERATHPAVGDGREFPRDSGFPIPAAVNLSKHRYDEPWYYGASHGMAFVQVFRRDDQVRFTQSPVGGGPGNPEWSFNWVIPNYEVGKLYRLVMRAMYVPFDSLHVGLVEPHLRALDEGAGSPASPKAFFLDDLTEVEFKVGHGTLGKHGAIGATGPGVPSGKASLQGRPFAHAVSTHPATGRPAYVVYNLGGQFASFRALAAISDLAPGFAVRTPVLFKAVADGKLVWTSAPIDRAGTGQFCSLDIQGVRALRLEVYSGGDDAFQIAGWLNPLLSTIAEPPLPPFSRETQWVVEGAEFKISETEKGALLELLPGNKLYSKIQIALTKSGTSWGGTGDLYFRSSPGRRYEARVEIPSEDLFSGQTLRVRTICPDAAMRTKVADTTSTWKKKE